MYNRREFLKGLSGATAGIVFTSCGLVGPALASLQAGSTGQAGGGSKRRKVMVGGRRVLTVDVHSHVLVPEVVELVKDFKEGEGFVTQLTGPAGPTAGPKYNVHNVDDRLARMDQEGLDVQALGINPFWYWADRNLAQRIIQVQNEKVAEVCAAHPDRFLGLGSVALQYPEIAAAQLEEGVKKMAMRGCVIRGSVEGDDLSAPKFFPFWEKAEELGTMIFIHPQGTAEIQKRLRGNGWLSNVIGAPLETTIALTHLIQEGILDRFPNLKICAAHGGGYLPSYSGRSDACQIAFPENCKPLKKLPSEYLKQLFFDSLVVTSEGLRHLVATVGSSQIVMGTDFPTFWNSHSVDHVLNTTSLNDTEKTAILSGNAAKLLRIDLPPGKVS